MWFFWFLLVVAVLAILMVALLAAKEETENEETEPQPLAKNLGSPLFTDGNTKTILVGITEGIYAWVLTPYGPQRMYVGVIEDDRAQLSNAEFEGIAFYDPEYLSKEVANKMSRGRGAWRLKHIIPTQTPTIPQNDPRWEAANRHWIEDAVDVDFFDDMVFYYFLFNGFDQPVNYYETYDPPQYEDPTPQPPPLVTEEPADVEPPPVVEQPAPVLEPPAEVNEGTFEPVDPALASDPVPEPVSEPAPEPTPEPVSEPAPEPTPEPVSTPEPAPAPECPTPEPETVEASSFDSPSSDFGSSDYFGSSDSGGSDFGTSDFGGSDFGGSDFGGGDFGGGDFGGGD